MSVVRATFQLLTLATYLVYKIPPLKANEGHRAQEWGDLANPLWKGRLRIIERSKGVAIQFEDATTGERQALITPLARFDMSGVFS